MAYIYQYFARMFISVMLLASAVIFLHESLWRIFLYNLGLNCVIMSCLALGVFLGFSNLFRLRKEQKWLESYDYGKEQFPDTPKAKILASLAILLSDPHYKGSLSTLACRSVLASVDGRLEETRDINRYLVGLLVFLGLLGTFWGLSETIGAIAGVINSIDLSVGDVKDSFQNLKAGLQSPLSGMGIAFSSSMFGLASSLIVSFLDLQNSKANNAFYQRLEDRLAVDTRMASGGGEISESSGGSGPAYSMGLLEQTIETMASLQTQVRRGEDNRVSVVKAMQTLSEKLSQMADQMVINQSVIKKIAQNQIDIQETILELARINKHPAGDELLKNHLRSLEMMTTKMLEEMIDGRNRTTHEIKNEIRVIARTLSAIANGQEVAA